MYGSGTSRAKSRSMGIRLCGGSRKLIATSTQEWLPPPATKIGVAQKDRLGMHERCVILKSAILTSITIQVPHDDTTTLI